ncbi:MAG: AgmX/PglI C-terminal domain-containing protein [Polyangiales bacterium]
MKIERAVVLWMLLLSACSGASRRAQAPIAPNAAPPAAAIAAASTSTNALAPQRGVESETSVDPDETAALIDEVHARIDRDRSIVDAGRSAESSAEALSPQQIRSVILASIDKVAECHEAALRRDSSFAGRVIVRFLIGPNGAVAAAGVVDNGAAHDRVALQCLVNVVRRLRFAAPEGNGAVTVNYPFNFAPPEPATPVAAR